LPGSEDSVMRTKVLLAALDGKGDLKFAQPDAEGPGAIASIPSSKSYYNELRANCYDPS
jgi:hypothetical protein